MNDEISSYSKDLILNSHIDLGAVLVLVSGVIQARFSCLKLEAVT